METTNVKTIAKKVATVKNETKKVATVKKQKPVIETIENFVAENVVAIVKNKVNKTTKLIETLSKVSGLSKEKINLFLVQNLASRKDKVKLNDYLTKLILRVAGGFEIPSSENTSSTEMFLKTISEQSKIDSNVLTCFIIKNLSSRPKTNLQAYFKDMFFKISMNKGNIVESINKTNLF